MDEIIEIEGSNNVLELDEASGRQQIIAIAIDGSGKGKNVIRWALEKLFVVQQSQNMLQLLHVRPQVTTVPTPMGNYIPISEVRDDVGQAYREEIEWQTNEKLLPYKIMCVRKKVKVEIVQIETDDVVQGILGEVSRQCIDKLVIGSSSRHLFSRGKQLSSKISELCPRFCTVYVVSKGKLLSLRPADSKTFARPAYDLHSSSSFSTNNSSTHDYSYETGDSNDDTSSDRAYSGMNETYTAASSFRSFIDHHDEQHWTNDQVLNVASSSEPQVNMNFELEKIRIELKRHREMCEMAQNEAKDVSKKLNDLKLKQLDEAVKFTEILDKQDEVKEEAEEKEKHESAHTTHFAEREAAENTKVEEKCEVDEAREEEMQEHDAMEGQYRKFTWEDIAIATSSFSEKFKIGKGGYGTVYKGSFHHTVAAVKVRHSKDVYKSKQFHQELEIMSKIRHPHLLSLLGACPEKGCLVYEFMENGSLEEYLVQKKNSHLQWYERYRITWEIATALVYLHTSKPKPIIHRDLKPENILLDRNLISKIGDVGLSTYGSVLYQNIGAPVGTFCYIDPEYQRTGVISPKSDVYAFGMIILRLITAKPAIGLAHLVEKAVENDCVADVFDQEGGEWPLMETTDLVLLGLRCTELRSQDRPDLQDEILPVLEKLKDVADKARDRGPMIVSSPPNHFICPISKEVMEEPCVAADGYTYERKAIEVWLENNEKSPITNLCLLHKHLLPNYTLLSAIREWKSSHNL